MPKLGKKKRKKLKFGDITLFINPDRNEVVVRFAQPMIYTGAKSDSGFDFREFSFMTEDHPSLPYRTRS